MPVAPYDTERYREWNRRRMQRVREDADYRQREREYGQRWREQNPDKVVIQSILSGARRRLTRRDELLG